MLNNRENLKPLTTTEESDATKQDEMPAFALYLSDPNVHEQIQKNIVKYAREMDGRLFNDLPGDYPTLQPLLDSIYDAIKHNELDLWIDFAIYIGITDLFDAKGNLQPIIYDLLNAKQAGSTLGAIDAYNKAFSAEKMKKLLLSSYLIFLSDRVLTVLKNKIDPNLQMDSNHPVTVYSMGSNKRSRDIPSITSSYVKKMKYSLISHAYARDIQSTQLQMSILDFLKDRNIFNDPVTTLLSTFSHFKTKACEKLGEIAEEMSNETKYTM